MALESSALAISLVLGGCSALAHDMTPVEVSTADPSVRAHKDGGQAFAQAGPVMLVDKSANLSGVRVSLPANPVVNEVATSTD